MNIRCDEPMDEGTVAYFGDLRSARRLMREFTTGERLSWALAINEQHRIAALMDEGERAIEGLGQHVAAIHPRIFHKIHKGTDGEAWRDPGTFQKMLRDNPMFRVRYQPKAMVTSPGMPWKVLDGKTGEDGGHWSAGSRPYEEAAA